ncbi:MAG: hybrid sensor histidine kinase/response regulator [Actinobacteria bacterium]|nr:MAG: hybrid sensor histidine kinase/response regulator [Actinomycetota bacterium]
MVTFDRNAFISKFREEADEHLARLNEGIIELEERPHDADLLDELFREAHTLKGASKMVGILDVSEVSHKLEDLLAAMRAGRIAPGGEISDLFFEALDAIVFLSDAAVKEEKAEFPVEELCSRLADAAATGETEDSKLPAAREAQRPAGKATVGKATAGKTMAGATAGATAEGAPQADGGKPKSARAEGGTAREEIEPAPDKTADEADEEERPVEAAARRPSVLAKSTIRVKTAQVDKLLNLVGEMVIGQIKAEQRLGQVKDLAGMATETCEHWSELRPGLQEIAAAAGPHGDELRARVAMISDATEALRQKTKTISSYFTEDTARMGAVVRELQEDGMQLRMLPVANVFNAFPRAVRDMAKDFNKKIKLHISGAETQLDKKVLEEINDPLIHIVRNSVDHGIEDPEERLASGKPEEGTIELSAAQEGDHIVIKVNDDGRGMDPDRIREAAVNHGILSRSEAGALTDREALFLTLETGFTTSQIITEMSGRGIGLDVVKQYVVEKLKGSINLESEMGKGTTIILTLPLTLAIIRALLVRVSGQTFALPTTSVEETLTIGPEDISKTQGREAIRLRRRTVPLVRLDQLLRLPPADSDPFGKTHVVVLGMAGQRIGLVVDELSGEQQIVLKSLGSHLKRVPNVAGATVLGAGEIVIILLVPDLMNSAKSIAKSLSPYERAGGDERAKLQRVLVVEDSFTTRELERSIFEASGYEVDVAVDGADALEKLGSSRFDVIVTDVQMPRLNGFELTEKVKSDPRFAQIPVVIVTSLEREEEKRRGIEVGADAYVTKSVFNQDTLLEIVERLTR